MTPDQTREQVRVALAAEAYALPPDQLSVPAREWVDRVTARVMDAIRPTSPPSRCAVEGCGQDPLRDGRCLQHVAPVPPRPWGVGYV